MIVQLGKFYWTLCLFVLFAPSLSAHAFGKPPPYVEINVNTACGNNSPYNGLDCIMSNCSSGSFCSIVAEGKMSCTTNTRCGHTACYCAFPSGTFPRTGNTTIACRVKTGNAAAANSFISSAEFGSTQLDPLETLGEANESQAAFANEPAVEPTECATPSPNPSPTPTPYPSRVPSQPSPYTSQPTSSRPSGY